MEQVINLAWLFFQVLTKYLFFFFICLCFIITYLYIVDIEEYCFIVIVCRYCFLGFCSFPRKTFQCFLSMLICTRIEGLVAKTSQLHFSPKIDITWHVASFVFVVGIKLKNGNDRFLQWKVKINFFHFILFSFFWNYLTLLIFILRVIWS